MGVIFKNYIGIKPGETFAFNIESTEIPEKYKSLKTIRLGTVAFDATGKPLPDPWRPVFINMEKEMETTNPRNP